MSFLHPRPKAPRHARGAQVQARPAPPERTDSFPAPRDPDETAEFPACRAWPRHARYPVPMNREPVPAVRPYVTRHLDVLTAPMEQLVAAGLADDPRPAARPAKVFVRDYRMPAFRAAVRARGFLALHTRRFGGTA